LGQPVLLAYSVDSVQERIWRQRTFSL
jgi:hypothetical protein